MNEQEKLDHVKTWVDNHDGECRYFRRMIITIATVGTAVIGWLTVNAITVQSRQEAVLSRLDEHGRQFAVLLSNGAEREARMQKSIDELRSDIKDLVKQGNGR